MPLSRGFSSIGPPGRILPAAGIAFLACLLVISGCTAPVIPSPLPATTTAPPVATTQVPPPPATTRVPATTPMPSYLTYSSPENGFSISYPSGWTVQEGKGGSVVTFTAPSSGMGSIPATVKIFVEDISANPMGLEQYKNAQLAKRQSLSGYNIVYDLFYKGTGYNGWKIGYTYQSGTLMKTFELYIMRGTMVYTITYSSKEDQFAAYSQQFDTMIKSFQLTG